jgi:hypothetical protein
MLIQMYVTGEPVRERRGASRTRGRRKNRQQATTGRTRSEAEYIAQYLPPAESYIAHGKSRLYGGVDPAKR